MSFTVHVFLSLLIGVPAFAGLLRFHKTDPQFRPFLLVLFAGFANEIASTVLALSGFSTHVTFNFYSLLESVLLLWQMARWQAFRERVVYIGVQSVLIGVWCWETLYYHRFETVSSYHLIAYSAVVVVLSTHVINRVIYQDPTPLLRNPVFLTCFGLIILSIYFILIELFWLHGLSSHASLRISLLSILPFINLFCNVLFTLAVLWAPMHYRFIMRF